MDSLVPCSFEYSYGPSTVRYGVDCVENIQAILDKHKIDRVIIVCGKNVGQNNQVMRQVTKGVGEHLVGIFDETTPKKTVKTALDGARFYTENDADGIVALGGGSSMDIARAISVFVAEDGEPITFHASLDEEGELQLPNLDREKPPVIGIPTTFSGAELTSAAGVNYPGETTNNAENIREGPIYDPKIVPIALFYDPKVLSTTPDSILASSAMNGLDHGIEMVYSRNSNPITDAMALHGLRILDTSLPGLLSRTDEDVLGNVAVGVYLCSYGLIDPVANANKYNIIHAFGHIISRNYNIQQGNVHGIIAPHVLEYLFKCDSGRPKLLANAFNIPIESGFEKKIVDRIKFIRDSLGLPSALNSIDDLHKGDLSNVAIAITQDVGLKNGPPNVDLSSNMIEEILNSAWK